MRNIIDQLIIDEGFESKPYKDTTGHWTIGVGRNLSTKGLTAPEILYLLTNDIEECTKDVRASFNWFDDISVVRQNVLINMRFNLGLAGLKSFKKMIRAIGVGNFIKAATEMLDSKWASQVGERAIRLAEEMRTGG